MIEENGISTVVLTPMPEFNDDVGIPRSVAIEYPFGRPVGQTNDVAGQRAVLLETLALFEKMQVPGEVRHLSYTWPEAPKDTDWHPPEISPIVKQNLEAIKKMKV